MELRGCYVADLMRVLGERWIWYSVDVGEEVNWLMKFSSIRRSPIIFQSFRPFTCCFHVGLIGNIKLIDKTE